MANISAKYVKFLRGTPTAFNNLVHKNTDTLYFIAEKDSATGKLYLGETCISGTISEGSLINYLSELKDVNTAGAVQNSLLGFDAKKEKWIPMDIRTLVSVSVMSGASETAPGSAGIVPAPAAGDHTKFLRGDGVWADASIVVDNINGLNAWIKNNRNNIEGLYPTAAENKLIEAISRLDDLTQKTSANSKNIMVLNTRVDELINNLTNFVSVSDYNKKIESVENDINVLKETITWDTI